MEIGNTEQMNPRPGEEWGVTKISEAENTDEYEVKGVIGDTQIDGRIKIFHIDGEWDGYEWVGEGFEEIQTILDGFTEMYD